MPAQFPMSNSIPSHQDAFNPLLPRPLNPHCLCLRLSIPWQMPHPCPLHPPSTWFIQSSPSDAIQHLLNPELINQLIMPLLDLRAMPIHAATSKHYTCPKAKSQNPYTTSDPLCCQGPSSPDPSHRPDPLANSYHQNERTEEAIMPESISSSPHYHQIHATSQNAGANRRRQEYQLPPNSHTDKQRYKHEMSTQIGNDKAKEHKHWHTIVEAIDLVQFRKMTMTSPICTTRWILTWKNGGVVTPRLPFPQSWFHITWLNALQGCCH